MIQFGIGGMWGRPFSGNLATPSGPRRFGIIQNVDVEFTGKNVPLRGQSQFPDDVAPSDKECKGKASFGQIDVEIYNALFFADIITVGIKRIVGQATGGQGELIAVPATPGPYTVTVTHSANFIEDLGVFTAAGVQLQQITAGGELAGISYSVVETGAGKGVYTFNAGDQGKTYYANYAWTDTSTGQTLTVTNHIQGYGPVFELWLDQPYSGPNGMHLLNCRANKMSAPMKRDGYLISDFEFEAFAASGTGVFEWFQSSPLSV